MLMHTELFSNVSGLGLGFGLIHCGLGLEKKFWASASASCPAGLVNISDVYTPEVFGRLSPTVENF